MFDSESSSLYRGSIKKNLPRRFFRNLSRPAVTYSVDGEISSKKFVKRKEKDELSTCLPVQPYNCSILKQRRRFADGYLEEEMKKKNKITGMPLMMALLFCSVSAMPFSLGLAGGSLNPLDRMNAVFEAWTTVAGVFVTPYHPINSFDWSRFIDDAAAEPAAPANTMGDESSVVASLTDSEWTDIHSPLAGISQTVPAGKAVCKAERAIRRNVKPVVLQNMAVNVNAEYEIKVNVVPAVDRVLATLRVPVMKFRNEIRQRNAIDYERLKVKLVTLEAKADNLSSAELAELVRAVKRRSKSKPPSPTFTCDGNAYFVPSGNTEAFEREVRVKMSERTPLGSEGPRL